MQKRDIVIVGAGLLGCFAARALSQYALDVTVLEARNDVCTGVSRANTGIIYAGYDTKPGTLKTRLCVAGNRGMAELCRELDVPFSRCGSLMVACGDRAGAVLQKKYAAGLENGVEGLRLLTRDEVLAAEPHLTPRVTGGLYAPGTGTLDPWALGIAAFENARANGVAFRFGAAVRDIRRSDRGFVLETDSETYLARAVLNCAGLAADRVRELVETPLVRIFPSAADYLVLDDTARGFVRHVIFHEPEEKGKGLTLVPTVGGNLLIGPTERDRTDPPGATSEAGLALLRALCAEIVPELDLSQTIRSFGADRPNPYYVREDGGVWRPEARGISSFTVLEEAGLISLIGIKTPGLTSAKPLGDYAAEKLLAWLGGAPRKPDFDPRRRAIPEVRRMAETDRAAFVAAHPDYGAIVCRCRGVSEGEIREAIRRGAVSVDGVKRRTGAGMGRCQGAVCTQHVLALLAEAQGVPESAICKDGPGSEVLHGAL